MANPNYWNRFEKVGEAKTEAPKGDYWSKFQKVEEAPPAKPKAPEEGLLSSFGRGILAPLISMARPPAEHIPMMSREQAEQLDKAREKYQEEMSQKPNTAGGRILHNIGEFVGGALPFMGGAPTKLGLAAAKQAAKFAGFTGGAGAASGVAQEAGINPLVADIGAGLAIPSIGIGANKLKAFFSPRAKASKILTKEGQGLHPHERTIEGALEPFQGPPINPEDIGANLYEELLKRSQGTQGIRANAGNQLYNAASHEPYSMAERNALHGQLGDVLKDVERSQKAPIQRIQEQVLPPKQISEKALRGFENVPDDVKNQILEALVTNELTPQQLQGLKRSLEDTRSSAVIRGEADQARIASQAKAHTQELLHQAPGWKEAEKSYEMLSVPTNTREDVLGKFTAQKPYTKEAREYAEKTVEGLSHLPEEERVPAILKALEGFEEAKKGTKESLMRPSAYLEEIQKLPIEDARYLKQNLGRKNIKDVEGAFHKEVLKNLVDNEGKVTLKKAHTFLNSNPAVGEFLPDISKNLESVKKADAFVGRVKENLKGKTLFEVSQIAPRALFESALGYGISPYITAADFLVGAAQGATSYRTHKLVERAFKDPKLMNLLFETPIKDKTQFTTKLFHVGNKTKNNLSGLLSHIKEEEGTSSKE